MIALLLGCTSGEPVDSAPVAEDTDWFTTAALSPEFTPEAVDSAAETAFREGTIFPFEQSGWVEGLIEEFAEDDAQFCIHPITSTEAANTWTLFGKVECTGAVHQMYGTWLLETMRERPDASTSLLKLVHLYSFWGEVLATGERVEGGGAVQLKLEQHGESMGIESEYGGHFVDPAFDGRLAAGVSGMVTTAGSFARMDGFDGTIRGSISGGGAMAHVDEVRFTRKCAAPSGNISVRDPSGAWWTVALPDDCSGCGPLSWNGEVRGESCAGLALADAVHEALDDALDNPP